MKLWEVTSVNLFGLDLKFHVIMTPQLSKRSLAAACRKIYSVGFLVMKTCPKLSKESKLSLINFN